MRDIKFRAWDDKDGIEDGKMVYFDLSKIYANRSEGGIWQDNEYIGLAITHLNKEQYTGFKDKNGVDIYEGDIVEFYHKGEIVQTEIVWNDKGMWSLKWGKNDVNNWYLNPSKYEVVGNIHEKI